MSMLGTEPNGSISFSIPRTDLLEVYPPLHCAALLGFADLVRLLVSHGVDVNSTTGLDRV